MAVGGPWTLLAVVQHYAWGREASESEVLFLRICKVNIR